MRIRYLVAMVGTDYVRNVGDECDVSEGEAARLIESGYAAPVAAVESEDDKPRKEKRKAAK